MNSSAATTPGALYIVATPIGNLNDITLRAIETLKTVDLILAEDTRRAKILLNAYKINTRLQSYHAHNEKELANNFIKQIISGENIALISDAGTPLIQDPGFLLVKRGIELNIPIIPIPGASALITALCASGIGCDRFLFAGFLPPKKQARIKLLQKLMNAEHTIIFYEATHRIIDAIIDIQKVFGENYYFVIAKELTKTFETFLRGTASEILDCFTQDKALIKGEFVILLPPVPCKNNNSDDEKLLKTLLNSLSLTQAVNIAAKFSGTSKNKLYALALTIIKDTSNG